MSAKTNQIDGHLCLSIETVAELYAVEVVWVEELVTRGLVGGERRHEGTLWIEARHLGRVATVVRLCHGYGLDIETARSQLT
jgi:hypothetical protein